MKNNCADLAGRSIVFARKSRLFSIPLFRNRDMRHSNIPRVVFPVLLPLIFSLAVLGGTASAFTEGDSNNFFGISAGDSNTDGISNSFFGADAGAANTTGYGNSFLGRAAGYRNTTGYSNSFFGRSAGEANTTGYYNSFFGRSAGANNTDGDGNSFFGQYAGLRNTVENDNTFIGYYADLDGSTESVTNATAIGYRAFVSQSDSLVLGSIAGVNSATANVNVGIGTPAPARQLHIAGDNAVFRMDRSADTAAFMLVRTDGSGNPLKSFVVGTNASGANTGEFIINDLGTAVGGPGTRRMTIDNDGNVSFTGTVTAIDFLNLTPSSLTLKTNVRTYDNALDTVSRLRGVRFDWKDSGKPSVGLIAEEVEEVVPEVVSRGGNVGTATGVNYTGLVGVLVEAVKEQQMVMEGLKKQRQIELATLMAEVKQQQDAMTKQEDKINKQQEAISQLMDEITKLKNRDRVAQR